MQGMALAADERHESKAALAEQRATFPQFLPGIDLALADAVRHFPAVDDEAARIEAGCPLPPSASYSFRKWLAASTCARSSFLREASMVMADSRTLTMAGIISGLLGQAACEREKNGLSTTVGRSF